MNDGKAHPTISLKIEVIEHFLLFTYWKWFWMFQRYPTPAVPAVECCLRWSSKLGTLGLDAANLWPSAQNFTKIFEALQASWGTQKPMNIMRTSLLSSAAALTRTCSRGEEQGRERMWCINCICTSYKGVYLFDCTCDTLKREPSEVWELLDLRVSDM